MGNIRELKMSELQTLIENDILSGDYDPMLVFGKAGVGKTESLKTLAGQLNIGYKEIRLITMSEIDMYGLPTIVDVPIFDMNGQDTGKKRQVTIYVTPGMFPDERSDGEVGILVLDEITSCQPQVRAAAYQLLDVTRGLGEYRLPKKWKIIAIGNGEEDGGVFNGMESAFVSRAMTYRVEPDFKSWYTWAVNNNVNSSVIAFLKFGFDGNLTDLNETERSIGLLHRFDEDDPSSPFPCPRTWKKLSDKLNATEKRTGGKLDENMVEIYAAGAVGEKVAAQFCTFYTYNEGLLDPQDVLSGKLNGSELDAYQKSGKGGKEKIYLAIQSVVSTLARELSEDPKTNGKYTEESVIKVANVCNWCVGASKVGVDYAIAAISDLSDKVQGFKDIAVFDDAIPDGKSFDEDYCPSFLQWCSENHIMFGGH